MPEILICRKDEFGSQSRIVTVGALEVGVFRHGDGYVAYRNLCPHQGGPACEGVVMPRVVAVLNADQSFQRNAFDTEDMHFVCPWHGYEYRIATGECVGDERLRLQQFPVSEHDGNLYITV
ncbi:MULTISPECIES: Rieske (2Fe-2S) protein [Roseomonadaceae]|uniref:Rieske (2Fe-2S) protein n=1 Tax=Muricoccus vinaceus TaxID=424704 RepID=A0ABV6IQF0_9PROT|nr:Rieske 2Fe-2S domain-containing protein [Roseomonas sp. KE2513]